ncbi:hypothetical protein [Sphingobacterium hungaricum]|nr:hypothetical protein [Sphingobacterium hungaricum]
MKRIITLLMLSGFIAVGLLSCSKETVDSAGRDVALNIIRTGVWEKATKTVSGNTDAGLNITTQLLDDDQTMNFDKDGRAWVKTEGATTQTSYSYSMPTNRKMIFDGTEYSIEESIVQSITTLTLINVTGPVRTQLVIKRKR